MNTSFFVNLEFTVSIKESIWSHLTSEWAVLVAANSLDAEDLDYHIILVTDSNGAFIEPCDFNLIPEDLLDELVAKALRTKYPEAQGATGSEEEGCTGCGNCQCKQDALTSSYEPATFGAVAAALLNVVSTVEVYHNTNRTSGEILLSGSVKVAGGTYHSGSHRSVEGVYRDLYYTLIAAGIIEE